MKLIVFEGIDGAGKSSLMRGLISQLEKRGISYIQTREPGGTGIGDQIREIILKKQEEVLTPRAELLLYQASRAQHVEKLIRPALDSGQWVLCDRFTASSMAFQGGGRGLADQDIQTLSDFATSGLIVHLTVLLDLSVEESRRRRGLRSQADPLQQEDRIEAEANSFHQRVRDRFLTESKKATAEQAWLVLDAAQEPTALVKQLEDYLIRNHFFSNIGST